MVSCLEGAAQLLEAVPFAADAAEASEALLCLDSMGSGETAAGWAHLGQQGESWKRSLAYWLRDAFGRRWLAVLGLVCDVGLNARLCERLVVCLRVCLSMHQPRCSELLGEGHRRCLVAQWDTDLQAWWGCVWAV